MFKPIAGWMTTLTAIIASGCASMPLQSAAFISDHGGLVSSSDAYQGRLEVVSKPLVAACTGRKITVGVLATKAVTAYSLWDGHIFVTRGLMDHLNDAELQAAVAHELGHLLTTGHVRTVASLRGCCVDPDREVKADSVGVDLLESQGLCPTEMVRMLKKVQVFGSLPPACVVALDHRIAVLRSAAKDR